MPLEQPVSPTGFEMNQISELEWRGEILTIRPASVEDVPAIVSFHRESAHDDRPDDDSPVAWFNMGGPWMNEYYCSRHIQAYLELGWDCWVVERNDGTLAGSVEICYATEPLPFGRYAHLEFLDLCENLLGGEVEEWVLDICEARARARKFDRFWCRPVARVGVGTSWPDVGTWSDGGTVG